ncbi:MAG TPA: sialidase family protein [Streptosporangiaceae bacterium]|nr:sialidase family protein [Streptosporangiaceae bacterium]
MIVTTQVILPIAAALLASAALAASAAPVASAAPDQAAPARPLLTSAVFSSTHAGGQAPGLLTGVTFTSPRHGYGLFTTQRGSRCQAAVGATSDGGRRFTRPARVAAWSCGGYSFSATLAASARGDVFWFGPALFTSQDGGRAWHRARPGGTVLTLAAAGRSAWALVARCHGRGQQLTQCPVRLIVSADGGRTWRAARHQLPGATVPGFGRQPDGTAELVRAGPAAYVLTSPEPSGRPAGARIWVSRDGGATWSRHPVPCGLQGLSAALAVTPDGTIFVACAGQPSAGAQAKSLASSADGGRTWTLHRPCRTGAGLGCPPVSSGYLGQIAAPAGRTVFLTGPRSSLLVTRDGGRAWHLVRPLIGDSGGGADQVIFFGAAGRAGLVFGFDARRNERPAIWHTSDGGTRWQAVFPAIG